MTITQLFPFPGAKGDSKYDRHLYPQLNATAICEPFAGSCARSIRYSHLPTYLGEINPAQRAIALALHNPQQYIDSYQEAHDRFWRMAAFDRIDILNFAGVKQSQKALKQHWGETYAVLTQNWKEIANDLFYWMHSGRHDVRMAGYYAFCIRACFGNVMRLNPKQTHFNVTWHVDKLKNACDYSPERWIEALQAKQWNPTVLNCWEEVIAAVPNPETTWLLLDPPYFVNGITEKCTPCYSAGHTVTTQDGLEHVFKLAVDSLQAGLERGFTHIDCCNYYDPRLDAAMRQLTADAGYSITAHLMGECKALGNSNGRRVHGNRVDKRSRSVEVIYRISRAKQRQWSGVASVSVKQEQLSLLEGAIA
jgi:site-specific DNA-adenine methylase